MNRTRSSTMRGVVALLLLPLLPAFAHAEAVHKCVADGHVTYQSSPCPQDDQVIHVWQSAPSAADAAAAAARVQAAKQAVASDAPKAASAAAHGGAAPASGPQGGRHHR